MTLPLYTAEEMRAAEAGHDAAGMMELAGRGVAEAVLRRFPDARRISCVCGEGSNGGDGRIAARVLREAGRDAVEELVDDADVVVDALFGTGFRGEPRPDAAALIERVNRAPAPVVAVDVPSGVDASTGEVAGVAVEAALTVTMHAPKIGLVVAPGRFHAGDVEVVGIGVEHDETAARLVTEEILRLVPRRGPRDTKYTAGHVLVVGGSPGLSGAPSLAAAAAMRADAGYVTVAVPRSVLPVVEQRLVEAVKRPLAEDEDGRVSHAAADDVLGLAERAGAVALGPGLGRSDGTRAFVRRLLAELEVPVVVDADALWELEPGEWPAPRVLTPHEGELARLLGEESRSVAAHRLEAARRAVERFRCVVLLKGSDTIVAAPGEAVLVSALGLPSLATAGTGDVLTGIVGAFLAKGLDARTAAAAGAAAQQRASLEAPQRSGLVASDLVEALPRVLG